MYYPSHYDEFEKFNNWTKCDLNSGKVYNWVKAYNKRKSEPPKPEGPKIRKFSSGKVQRGKDSIKIVKKSFFLHFHQFKIIKHNLEKTITISFRKLESKINQPRKNDWFLSRASAKISSLAKA